MRNIIALFLFCGTVGFLLSCSGGGTVGIDNGDGNGGGHVLNASDTIPPVITITTPTDNQAFSNGSTIAITGRITDENGLYRGSVRVTDDANGNLLKQQLYEIHGLTGYNYSVSYQAIVSALANYTVTVSFEDHGNNVVSKSVKVKVNP